MSIHKSGMNDPMSFVTITDDDAIKWTIKQVWLESVHSGQNKPEARKAVARQIGINPGTIENMERGRLKGLKTRVRDLICGHMIRALEQGIERQTHVLEGHLQCGASPISDEILAAQTALETARKSLETLTKLRAPRGISGGVA